MTISENKHSWMKIIIAIAMSFCGLLGIQMQYLNYTSTGSVLYLNCLVCFLCDDFRVWLSIRYNVMYPIQYNDSSDSAPFGNRNIPFFALYNILF